MIYIKELNIFIIPTIELLVIGLCVYCYVVMRKKTKYTNLYKNIKYLIILLIKTLM